MLNSVKWWSANVKVDQGIIADYVVRSNENNRSRLSVDFRPDVWGQSTALAQQIYLYQTAETTDDFLFRLLCAVCYVSWLVWLCTSAKMWQAFFLFFFSTWHTAGQLYLIIPYKAINANDAQVLYNATTAAAHYRKETLTGAAFAWCCVR